MLRWGCVGYLLRCSNPVAPAVSYAGKAFSGDLVVPLLVRWLPTAIDLQLYLVSQPSVWEDTNHTLSFHSYTYTYMYKLIYACPT